MTTNCAPLESVDGRESHAVEPMLPHNELHGPASFSLHVRKSSSSTPSDSQATTDVSSNTTNVEADAATLDSHSFGSTASLKRMTSLASQSSAHAVGAATNAAVATASANHVPSTSSAHVLPERSFLIPPGVVLYRMASTTTPARVVAPPVKVAPVSHAIVDGSTHDVVPKEVKSELSSRLAAAAADPESPREYLNGYDHLEASPHAQPPLILKDYTPPTSLNVTPTKLFSRPGNVTALDATDALVLSPPAVVSRAASMATRYPDESTTTLTDHGPAAATLSSQPASFVGSIASSSTSSYVTGGTGSTTVQSQQPVLYSAIGSLEHASHSFTKGWKNRAFSHKFDFPSSTLLAPPTHVVAKRRNALESNGTGTASVVRERSVWVDKASGTKAQPPARRPLTMATADPGTRKRMGVLKRAGSSSSSGKLQQLEDDESKSSGATKKVTISRSDMVQPQHTKSRRSARSRTSKNSVVEMFRPSSDAYTPRMGKKEIKFKPAEQRTPVQQMASPLGTLSRPNFRDALRRVAMILHQHIVKIERRFERKPGSQSPRREEDDGLFSETMKNAFSEDRYVTPRYKCTMVRVPMARSGMVCGLKPIREKYEIPTEGEIYEFAHHLFKTVQLSSECSIVCLIYVERLMEAAKVPVLASTWRPIFMCGLLLASKVWQDLSSWNIEFASVYPQYSLESINRLELHFLRMVKWDLYISSSQYAKYYFALRSLVEKPDFRQRYNRMVGGVDNVHASHARKIEERSTMVKEEALLYLSRSM